VLVAIAAIVFVDYAPYQRMIATSSYPRAYQLLAAAAPYRENGRLAFFLYGESELSLLPVLDGFDLIDGYSLETTPHFDTIVGTRLAGRSGYPAFMSRTLLDWNVGTALVDQHNAELATAFEEAGFARKSTSQDDVALLVGPGPRQLQSLTRNAIVIGRGAQTMATVFPWMSYGTSWNVDDYPTAYLDHFNLIYLYDFAYHDSAQLSQRIRSWVAAGKTVVLDLTGMPDSALLGAVPLAIDVPAQPRFRAGAEADMAFEQIADQPFGDSVEPWRGISYAGLDGSLLDVQDSAGTMHPIIGFRTVGDGRVYFVGLNWATHTLLTKDRAASAALDSFFERAHPRRALGQPGFAVQAKTPVADTWEFSYQTSEPTMVMVSETWSPHWQAQLDGQPLAVYNHEQLIALQLPPGTHRVTFQYQPTSIQVAGWGLTGVSALLAAFLIVTYRRHPAWLQVARQSLI
jgi:hypothetical protein